MRNSKMYKGIAAIVLPCVLAASCTKLDQHVYSVVPNENFWQTPQQIAAGVAPAYQALTGIPDGDVFNLNEGTSDAMIVPTRGGDWYDNGNWQALWTHSWTPTLDPVNNAWNAVYNGIGKINFTLFVVNNLTEKPTDINDINSELQALRTYYYFWAMDMFGNVPLVTDFNTNPNSVSNSTRKDVYNFIESELKNNIQGLSPEVNASTYGRFTKWAAFSLLAKLYLNAEVYTGTPQWQKCIDMCDSVLNSGLYSLETNYFNNFAVKNEGSKENIFVVPFDNINIGGNNWEMATLHYQNQANFQLTTGPWNGFCSAADFYSKFDTTSTYATRNGRTYRTYHDSRAGQYLVGQQFSVPYTFPPDKNVLVAVQDSALVLKDEQTKLNLSFTPVVAKLSDPSAPFRLAGVRNIKYFPEPGTQGNQSNDMVLFRLADIMLMKAEAELRLGTNLGDALDLVNQIRSRAYGGDVSHNWTAADLTLDNLLAERARELTWELWRRQDLIRFEVAAKRPYFTAARTPDKPQDPQDGHTLIFPIPAPQITANPNLHQNPGY